MIPMCLVSFAFLLLSSFSVAHWVPQHELLPRQVASNSSFASSTSISVPTSTGGSSTPVITSSPSSSGNESCPQTYAPDFPVEFLTFTTKCQEFSARMRDDKYYYYADECLETYCNVAWTSMVSSYVSASQTKTATTTRVFFSGSFGSGSLSTVVVSQSTWTVTATYVVPPPQAVTPVPPCCGSCTISAATVQLYFWPGTTETVSPVVTGLPPNATAAISGLPVNGSGSYVDDSGFTFISPSIYIGFTSLGAHDQCGNVGTPIYNTTMAFDPTEISSILPLETTATCTAYENLPSLSSQLTTGVEVAPPPPQPLTYADVAQNCSTIDGYYYFTDNPSSRAAGDPCHPVLAIPTRVKDLQPGWNACGANYDGGFYDPPKTLHEGPLLVPTTADPGQSPSASAPPSTTALPPSLPDQTSAPDPPASSDRPQTPNDPKTPDPPSSQSPDNPGIQPGSSTTIVVDPPHSDPTTEIQTPGDPNNPNPPVITLSPQPNDPSDPTNRQPNPPVLTFVPTVVSPTQNNPNPQNPNSSPQSSGSVVIVGSQTLSPGGIITVGGTTSTLANGQTTVIGGTSLVLDPQGTQVIVDGTSTINLPPASPTQANPVALTIDGQTITPATSGPIIIGGQTLLPGSSIIVGGTTLSLAPGGTQIVVDGSTIPLTAARQTSDAPLVVTYDGTTLIANSLSQFIIDGKTLTPGGTITASGTTYFMTTNAQGSTILIAGTAGASSEATLTAIRTGANASSESGSPTAAGGSPAAPEETGVARSISTNWKLLSGLLCIGSWLSTVI